MNPTRMESSERQHKEETLPPRPGEKAEAAAPAPKPGILATKPALRGFLWATGTISCVGLLLFGVAQAAKPRPTDERAVGGKPAVASPQAGAVNAGEVAAKAALARNPENVEARLELARAYLDRQDFMGVWTETQHILARSPGDPRALTYQSQVRLAMGQSDVALGMLKKALASDPTLLQAYVYLSYVHLQMGQTQEAEAAIAEAVRRFPGQAAMLHQGFAQMKEEAAKQGPIAPAGEGNPHAALSLPGANPEADPPARPNPHAAAGRKLSGVLELDPALKGRIAPGSVAFVTVFDADFTAGPPVAAKRLATASFPLSFEIGDADSMMGLPIPDHLLLKARIDADGDPMTWEPHDPSARLDNVKAGSTGLRLVLRR